MRLCITDLWNKTYLKHPQELKRVNLLQPLGGRKTGKDFLADSGEIEVRSSPTATAGSYDGIF